MKLIFGKELIYVCRDTNLSKPNLTYSE